MPTGPEKAAGRLLDDAEGCRRAEQMASLEDVASAMEMMADGAAKRLSEAAKLSGYNDLRA